MESDSQIGIFAPTEWNLSLRLDFVAPTEWNLTLRLDFVAPTDTKTEVILALCRSRYNRPDTKREVLLYFGLSKKF